MAAAGTAMADLLPGGEVELTGPVAFATGSLTGNGFQAGEDSQMAVKTLDATGLKCPQPIMKIAVISSGLQPGDILEVTGDCPTFETDVRAWCNRLKKTLLFVRCDDNGYRKTIQIRY